MFLKLISELSDTVAACLVDITDVSSGLGQLEGAAVSDLIGRLSLARTRPRLGAWLYPLEGGHRCSATTCGPHTRHFYSL